MTVSCFDVPITLSYIYNLLYINYLYILYKGLLSLILLIGIIGIGIDPALVLPHSILFSKANHHEEFLGSLAAEVTEGVILRVLGQAEVRLEAAVGLARLCPEILAGGSAAGGCRRACASLSGNTFAREHYCVFTQPLGVGRTDTLCLAQKRPQNRFKCLRRTFTSEAKTCALRCLKTSR